MLNRDELEQIATLVAERVSAKMPQRLSIGAKVGIAVGGFFGSAAHVACMLPGAGQVCDFGRGVRWGFNEKLTEYAAREEAARREARNQVAMSPATA